MFKHVHDITCGISFSDKLGKYKKVFVAKTVNEEMEKYVFVFDSDNVCVSRGLFFERCLIQRAFQNLVK